MAGLSPILLGFHPANLTESHTIAYELYNLCDVQGHFAFPVRIQKNGEFEGTWDMVEDGDDIYLDRVGLSEFGALYKMYNRLDAVGNSNPFSENGGENLYAQGDYDGQLSGRGETLQLIDRDGVVVTEFTYEGEPSEPQLALRITEVLYNPNPPAEGSPYTGKDLEFIELHNTSSAPLDLTGVVFNDGISFAFEDGATLASGAYGVVVSNRAAFTSKFGQAPLVLGEYAGNLNNGGERIALQDAFNENILAFSYDQEWSTEADTQGHSLVVADAAANAGSWDLAEQWLTSQAADGTPGAASSGGPSQPAGVTYASWRTTVFSAAEHADDAVSGPWASLNTLGLQNLVAYGFNLDPKGDLATGLPTAEINDSYLTVTYRRHKKATDIDFEAQVSTDLSAWTVVATEVGDRVEIDESTEWVTVRSDQKLDRSATTYMRVAVKTK